MTTTAGPGLNSATLEAVEGIGLRLADAITEANGKADQAVVDARELAGLLEQGASPVEAGRRMQESGADPEEGRWARRSYTNWAEEAMYVVYRAWDERRGRLVPNPVNPLGRGVNAGDTAWLIAEHLLVHLGEPVAFADLKQYGSPTPARVIDLAMAVERTSDGKVVVRKTKRDGKAAYMLRERRDGDPDVTSRHSTATFEEKWPA